MKTSLVSIIYLLFFMGAAFLVIAYVLPFILPFALAVVLAALIEPPVSWLVKNARLSRGLAVGLVLAVSCGAFATILGVGVSRLITELFELSGSLPEYYRQASSFVDDMARMVDEITRTLPAPVKGLLEQQVSRVYQALEVLLGAVLEAMKGLPNLIGVLFITIIAAFFVSRDKDVLLGFLAKVVPGLEDGKVARARKEVLESSVGLLKAELLLITVTAMITTLALWLVGVNYALVLGLITGILDVLPVVGPGLVFIPWAIYSLVFGNVILGVVLLVLYGVVSAVRQVFEAKLDHDGRDAAQNQTGQQKHTRNIQYYPQHQWEG